MSSSSSRHSTPQGRDSFGAVGNVEFLVMFVMIVAVTILVGLLLTRTS